MDSFRMLAGLAQSVTSDQKLIIACLVISVLSACIFYHVLRVEAVTSRTRHLTCASLGVLLALLCYGLQAVHLLIQCGISYLCIAYLPPANKAWVTFTVSFGYLLAVHLYKFVYEYMEFPVGIDWSMMVMTTKISCTAFAVSDGYKADSQLTENQIRHKLSLPPSWLEFFSYCFCFLGILCGPTYFYDDYMKFIEGRQYRAGWPLQKVIATLSLGIISLGIHLPLSTIFYVDRNLSPDIMSSGILYRHCHLYLSMFAVRFKYYFVWLVSEAACLCCGLGYDETKSAPERWNSVVSTVRIQSVEFGTSVKSVIDSWNCSVGRWLHYCVYERVGNYQVLCTFLTSALWHGFYPGFFIMFAPLGLAILLGRKLRRVMRPHFQSSAGMRLVYDLATWCATAVLVTFNSAAMELKALDKIYTLQRSFYFWPHIALVLGLLLTPSVKSRSESKVRLTEKLQ